MALANLVLADGASSPANHTFTYDSEVPVARWSEKAGGIAIGEPAITIQASRPSRSRPSQKTTIKVETPILEVISGDSGGYTPSPKVAYTLLFEGHFVAPNRSLTLDRAHIFAFVKNLLAKDMVKSMIVDYAPAA